MARGIQLDSDVDFSRDSVVGSALHAKNAPSIHGFFASSSQIDSNCAATIKAAASAQPAVISNLRFPGQYFDASTGLRYHDRRYYDTDSSTQARDLARTASQGLQTKKASSPDGISASSSQNNSNLNAHVAGSFQEVIATVNSHHQL